MGEVLHGLYGGHAGPALQVSAAAFCGAQGNVMPLIEQAVKALVAVRGRNDQHPPQHGVERRGIDKQLGLLHVGHTLLGQRMLGHGAHVVLCAYAPQQVAAAEGQRPAVGALPVHPAPRTQAGHQQAQQ